MLTRNSKKLLKFLKAKKGDYSDNIFTFDFIEENYHRAHSDSTIRYLEKNGYLEYVMFGDSPFGVSLTEQSLHLYDFTYTKLKSFLLRSILTPILVSVLTTLLTLYITKLLS